MPPLTRSLPRAISLSKSSTTLTKLSPSTAIPLHRNLSSTHAPRSADHGDHYDPPSGWLFGVKPGEKPEKEGWENIWVYGFLGTCAFGVVGIQTWALEEARRRLEAEGILKEPEDK
ncbi:hypothetical protein CJF30_00009550 [Rutstroemia sp. NJR-2017a BBW]|nr:hypothetical protein CJF30_00009550 [Rutstroemia sp. NJR-2017a BBW]